MNNDQNNQPVLITYITNHLGMEPVAKSFAINVPMNQPRRQEKYPTTKAIHHIYAQTIVKQHNLDYQQLLIANKELQLRMEELKAELSVLNKQRKKADKLALQVTQKKELAHAQLKEKQCYLQRYHQELDKKFRGGRDDLFAGLKKLEQNLLQMYERDQKRITQSLQPEREQYIRIRSHLEMQRRQRDLIAQELNSLERIRNVNKVAHPPNERQELQAENQFIRNQIQRLGREKKTLENEERVLKKILNVQEEHKKHGAVIAGGIRKMFAIRVKEQRYKEAVAQEYAKNLVGLREIITQRRSQRQAFYAQLEQKRVRLNKLKEENKLKNKEYSQLEDELFSSHPK